MKKQTYSIVAYFTAFFWGIAIGIGAAVLISTNESGLLIAACIGFAVTPIAAWILAYFITREPRRYMQLIRCPECERRCEAIVNDTFP